MAPAAVAASSIVRSPSLLALVPRLLLRRAMFMRIFQSRPSKRPSYWPFVSITGLTSGTPIDFSRALAFLASTIAYSPRPLDWLAGSRQYASASLVKSVVGLDSLRPVGARWSTWRTARFPTLRCRASTAAGPAAGLRAGPGTSVRGRLAEWYKWPRTRPTVGRWVGRVNRRRRAVSRAVEDSNRRMLRARDAMDRTYAQPLDVRGLASIAHVSEAHFIRTFRVPFGETPHPYLQRRRVERSMFLLRETDRSVTAICLDVGFTSLGTFSRTFRAIVGESPKEYRARAVRFAVPNCFAMAYTRPSSFGEEKPRLAG